MEHKIAMITKHVETRNQRNEPPLSEKCSDFEGINLSRKCLKNADFTKCNFKNADFTESDLLHVILKNTKLDDAIMSYAKNLCPRKLSKANFTNIIVVEEDEDKKLYNEHTVYLAKEFKKAKEKNKELINKLINQLNVTGMVINGNPIFQAPAHIGATGLHAEVKVENVPTVSPKNNN